MSRMFLYELIDDTRCLILQIVGLVVFVFLPTELSAQSFSNIKTKTLFIESDTLIIDTFSIVPNSLLLTDLDGNEIRKEDYDFFPFSSKIIWKQRPKSSINATYRAYPMQLANRYFHKDVDRYRQSLEQFNVTPFSYVAPSTASDFIDFGSLDYAGNFSRGLSFGSNQDVVLNSVLNLQLQGKLTNDLEVIANVTDNNIPIQPDGNTQQIQEFDKIFIQLRKGKQSVTVGDFDMIESNGYFLRYSKKAQGARIDGLADFKKAGLLKVFAGGGISKGKFARNTLAVREGNQGPYKLLGTNGESFIIVLANTEEVFINGVKQIRGFDKDYVIDYNTGQITFTPRRIITNNLRIIVEFEYAERSYQRSIVATNFDYEYKKTKIGFGLYSEQDSKNQNLQQTLDDEKKRFLANIGDSLNHAFYPGVDSVTYDANRILYRKTDTILLLNGMPVATTFYSFSNDPLQARYALSFAYLGDGKGDYQTATTVANGRVYSYVQPSYDTQQQMLIHLGSYEPVIKLIAPAYNQVYTLNVQQGIGNDLKIGGEVALSNRDINMYSKKDDNDNIGVAAFGTIDYNKVLNPSSINKPTLHTKAEYEFVDKRFYAIERYRNVEFIRDFNLLNAKSTNNEHITKFLLGYEKGQLLNAEYRLRTYHQDSIYTGFEHFLGMKSQYNNWNINVGSSFLHSKSSVYNTLFARPNADVSYAIPRLKGWKVGVVLNHEFLKTTYFGSDTLDTRASHVWQEYRVYTQSPDTLQNKYRVEYFVRIEQGAKGRGYDAPSRIGHNISFSGNILSIKNQNLSWNLTYRRLYERDSLKAAQELKNYYLGRIDYSFNILKGMLRSTTFYQLGTGQQPKLQLIYVPSPTNKGDYIWQGDVNGNGQRDITEFVPLRFQTDTSYIRTFQYTADLVSVNDVEFNEALNINPATLIKPTSSKFVKALGLFSFFTSVQLSKKIYTTQSNKAYSYFLPWGDGANDTNIVQQTLNSKNSIFFNRFSSKINAQIDINYYRTKTLLTSGIEKRTNDNQSLTVRWNIWRELLFQTVFNTGVKANESDFYLTQQFNVKLYETRNELSYLYKNRIRVGVNYAYFDRRNKIAAYGGQGATQHQMGVDFRFSKSSLTAINTKFTYTIATYKDSNIKNAQAEFAILEGLRNGANYVWNVSFEQRLNSLLQLVISYDGRKTGTDKVVHSGRAEIRALF